MNKLPRETEYTPAEWRAIERSIRRHMIVIGGYQPWGWTWPMLQMLYPKMAMILAVAMANGCEDE